MITSVTCSEENYVIVLKYLYLIKGLENVDTSKLVSTDNLPRTRSTGVQLRCKQVQLDCTKCFFTNGMVRE